MSIDITALSIKVTSTGIKEASNAISGLSVSAGNAERKVLSFTAAMDKLNLIQRTSTTAAEAYMLKLREQAALMQSLALNSRGATGSTQALAAAMLLLSNSLNALNANTNRADRSQRRHNKGMREGNAAARGLAGSLGALWMTYSAFTGMAVGIAIGMSLKGIITIGKDVEHTLESIRVKGIESVKSINMLRDAVLDIGTGIHGPQAVVGALEVLILAGLNAQQAAVGVRDALNLSLIGGTTIEKAAEALVTVGTALGYTAEGYSRVADVIAKTAAISIASVDSIANTFKQASAVGKMYGVTLVDLGVQTAALSNLMVRGTAAGTAIKNFYSQLASGSREVTTGLALIGLTIDDLKDKDGNFKSYVEVMKTLRGPMENATTGMNKLESAAQKNVQAMLTNERGNRLFTESLSLIRKEGVLTATALEDMFKKVDESYAFAVVGAIAMSMTIKSQFDSVKNSLQTTLVKAFQDIQPELSLVAVRMKAAFTSPEFISGIQALAKGTANLAVFIAENASALWDMLRALIAFKAAAFVVGMLVGLSEALVAVKLAFTAARISAIAFQVAVGGLTLVLAAGAAAFTWWATKRDEATGSDAAKAGLNYMDDFTGKLDDESKRLENQLRLMKEGKTARDAETQSMREQQLELVKLQGTKIVGEAEESLKKIRSGFTDGQRLAISLNKTGIAPQTSFNKEAIAAETAGQKALQVAIDTTEKKYAMADASQKRLVAVNKAVAVEADRQAKASRAVTGGDGVIPGKTNTRAINDSYAAEQTRFNGVIKLLKWGMVDFEEKTNKALKAGAIGHLQYVQEVGNKEIATYKAIAAELAKQRIAASKGKNKEAAVANVDNLIEQNLANLEQSKVMTVAKTEVEITKLREEATKQNIKRLESEGKFQEAAALKFSSENGVAYKQAIADMLAYGDKFPWLADIVEAFSARSSAAMQEAGVKEAAASFDELHATATNFFKGVQTASENQGMGTMFAAAMEASQKYKDSLPELQAALEKVKQAAEGGSATDKTKYQEELTKLTGLAEKQRTMWEGVGKSISKSLENAFGDGGKALGKLAKISIAYNNEENKSGGAKVKMYGDMAQAAAGFFDEQSTGYKVLTAVSQVFHAAELAMSVAELVPKALGAILNQGNGDPYTAFGRMAAMAVIVAGLGVAIGGAMGGGSGGGLEAAQAAQEAQQERIKTQGTGTVLGDSEAKSESIQNSLDLLAQYAFQDLEYSNKMLTAMQSIASALMGVSKSLVLTQGLMSGTAFGTSEGKSGGGIMDSIFGGASSKSVTGSGINIGGTVGGLALSSGKFNQYEEITTQTDGGWFGGDDTDTKIKEKRLSKSDIDGIARTFSFVRAGLVEVGSTLGLGATQLANKINDIPIKLTAELRGLKGKELEEAVTAVFSAQIDLITKKALSVVVPYQKMGEGLFETAVRVANTMRVIDLELQSVGKTFGSVGIKSIKARMGLIDLMGGLEEFTSKTDFFKENFLSEDERSAPIKKALAARFKELGISSIDTMEKFKKLVLAQKLSSEAGQEMYSNLLEMAPAFKQVTDYTGQLIKDAQTLEEFRKSLLVSSLSPLSPEKQYGIQKQTALDTAKAAIAGDATAQGKMQDVMTNFLESSKGINASGAAYQSDFAWVQSALSATVNKMDGSHANGLAFVPFDGYRAELHKGEQVLTAPQAINYKQMGNLNMAPLVDEIKALREEVKNLRNDAKMQTSAVIQSNYDANEKNAETVVSGTKQAIQKDSYTQNSAPTYK